MSYRQHASGSFSAELVPGSAHCGLSFGSGTGHFKYTVDLEYSGDLALDAQGFLLDNLVFQTYFQGIAPIAVSCEVLARRCANDFKKMLGERVAHACVVAVAIYPFDDVFVEWREKGGCK